MLWKRIKIRPRERALLFKDGRPDDILPPGEHRFLVTSTESLSLERHSLRDPAFASVWEDYLLRKRSDLIQRHFTCVETKDTQIALVYVDSQLFTVLLPARRILFWRDTAQVTTEVVDFAAEQQLNKAVSM